MPTIKIVPMPGVSVPGPMGPQGSQGIQGETGLTGPMGPQGEPGESAPVPEDTSFVVNGGALGVQPTFTGDPMFYGSYVKTGDLVFFRIDVDFDNISSFGSGQYYVDLPLPSKHNLLVRSGCLHDISSNNQWAISGHVNAGESRMLLWFTSSAGQDEIFDHNSPINLSTQDNFHVSGSYIV